MGALFMTTGSGRPSKGSAISFTMDGVAPVKGRIQLSTYTSRNFTDGLGDVWELGLHGFGLPNLAYPTLNRAGEPPREMGDNPIDNSLSVARARDGISDATRNLWNRVATKEFGLAPWQEPRPRRESALLGVMKNLISSIRTFDVQGETADGWGFLKAAYKEALKTSFKEPGIEDHFLDGDFGFLSSISGSFSEAATTTGTSIEATANMSMGTFTLTGIAFDKSCRADTEEESTSNRLGIEGLLAYYHDARVSNEDKPLSWTNITLGKTIFKGWVVGCSFAPLNNDYNLWNWTITLAVSPEYDYTPLSEALL